MPKVRYHFREVGDEKGWTEEDILPPRDNIDTYAKQLVMLWNEKHPEDPERELVGVTVIDARTHLHEWGIEWDGWKTGARRYLKCINCDVTAKQSKDGKPIRDVDFADSRYDSCFEKLPKVKPPRFKK